jgi:hypothetical protein
MMNESRCVSAKRSVVMSSSGATQSGVQVRQAHLLRLSVPPSAVRPTLLLPRKYGTRTECGDTWVVDVRFSCV